MSIRSDKWFIKNFNNNCKYIVTHITDTSFREVMSAEEILFSFNFKWDYHNSNKIKFKDKYQLNLELAKLHGYEILNPANILIIGNYIIDISKEELMKGVIYPFVINSININDKGLKIPSKGLSSYGYDISLGKNFKIFSHDVFGDFKPYDPILKPDTLPEYVEETDADFIILPPLTFTLGHSVEHICVPKGHSVVCMAKSTLARCFTGDTEIALVDGTNISFIDLIERTKTGERFWGYSINAVGSVVVSELTFPRKIGNEKVIEILLDNDQKIKVTPDHKFILRSGEEVEAKDLIEGSSLMPLYRCERRGYEYTIDPVTHHFNATHILSDRWNIENGVYEAGINEHRHHLNKNKKDNRPINIKRLSVNEHIKMHNKERSEDPIYFNKISEIQRNAFAKNSTDPNWYATFIEKCRAGGTALWHEPEHLGTRERLLQKARERGANLSQEQREVLAERLRMYCLTEERLKQNAERLSKLWQEDPVFRDLHTERIRNLNIRNDITEESIRNALEKEGSIRGAARLLNCDRTTFRRFTDIILEFKDKWNTFRIDDNDIINALSNTTSIQKAAKFLGIGVKKLLTYKNALNNYYGTPISDNHKVISVKEIEGTHDVYCLTVPEHANFALAAGVFVKNCGINFSITPLECEWNGIVTLEIFNQTNQPFVLRSGVGAMQMQFFEGDEECAVSYADRKGKYMNQGLTPVLGKV